MHSTNNLLTSAAVSFSTGLLNAIMPPKALTGSQAKAFK